jgi:hypothetical protein
MAVSEFEVTEIVVGLLATYPSFQPKVPIPEMVKAYRRALGNLPPAAVRRGAAEITRESKFFPSAQEIHSAARQVMVTCRGHQLMELDDAGQRFQDELYGFAEPLLTHNGGEWSKGQVEEYTRLMGKKPRMVKA